MKSTLRQIWTILRSARFGLGLIYAVGFFVAQAGHTAHEQECQRPEALLLCLDPGQHWAPHDDAHDLDHASHACPVCAFRQGPHVAPACQAVRNHLMVDAHPGLPPPDEIVPARWLLISQRGPPRV